MIAGYLWALAAAVAAVAVARIAFLLLCRRPVAARTVSNSYGDMERLHERDMRIVARFDNIPTQDDIPVRNISARVVYTVDGAEYRADVALPTVKGERTNDAPVVWYDPAAPGRATGSGPGPAMLALFVAGGIAILAWRCPF